jgi:hypothetical protein
MCEEPFAKEKNRLVHMKSRCATLRLLDRLNKRTRKAMLKEDFGGRTYLTCQVCGKNWVKKRSFISHLKAHERKGQF